MPNICAQCRAQIPGATNRCPSCGFLNPIAKKGMGTLAIVLIVLVVLAVPGLGIFGVLGIYGVRKYIANAKVAEARNALGQMAKDAVMAYEGGEPRRLCPSATAKVPVDWQMISARKYQSTTAEWNADEARNAGFSCLKFEMSAPQYFQYGYAATATGFVITARGDLDGDGQLSTFTIEGKLEGDRLVVAPQITETDPEE